MTPRMTLMTTIWLRPSAGPFFPGVGAALFVGEFVGDGVDEVTELYDDIPTR